MEADGNVDPAVLYCSVAGCAGTVKSGTLIRACQEKNNGIVCGGKQFVNYARKQAVEKAAGKTWPEGSEPIADAPTGVTQSQEAAMQARRRAEEEVDTPRNIHEDREDATAPARKRFGF